MAKSMIKLNSDGVRALLRSEEAKNVCVAMARKATDKLGKGYEVHSYTGKNRVNAEIFARTYQARSENRKKNTILKALGG